MREFEQMEMQFFIRPGTQKEWYEYWKEERMKWHLSLGFRKKNIVFMIMSNWLIMQMQPVILNMNFPLDLKKWKAFTPGLILI